jgi:hypothetical protein
VEKMMSDGWIRLGDWFRDVKRGIWERNGEVVCRLLRDI